MMWSISIVLLATFLGSVLAGKFSLPIAKSETVLPKSMPRISNEHNQYSGMQKFMNRYSESSSQARVTSAESQLRGSPIEIQNFFLHTTNISVGTPPQNFRAIVDLNWSDLFLPSSSCGSRSSRYCTPSNATYNAGASSTYYDNGTITQLTYGPIFAYARLSEDILTFTDGLQIPGQVFHEVRYYEYVYPESGAELFDGVLGLAVDQPWLPDYRETPNLLPSPFRSMIDSDILDENMFSIVWPNKQREQGSLIFGGYDENVLHGKLVSHPLFPENTTSWQVELESVYMIGSNDCGDKKVLIDKPLPHSKAFFMSLVPSLVFPYSVAQSIVHHINSWPSACFGALAVDCDEVASLPEIIIGLKGQNISLGGEDYVQKFKMPDNCPYKGEECVLMINALPNFEDLVIFGMPFLQKVMGIFNWDEKTISFGELNQ